MPTLDGIQATKEIRQLENINSDAGYPLASPSPVGQTPLDILHDINSIQSSGLKSIAAVGRKPLIYLLFQVFCDFHHTLLDMFNLVLDLVDLPSKPIHVIIVNGGEAVLLQTAGVIGSVKVQVWPASLQERFAFLEIGG